MSQENSTLSKLATTTTAGNSVDSRRGVDLGSRAGLLDQFGSVRIKARIIEPNKTQVGPESGKPGKITEPLLFNAELLPHFDVFLIFPIGILQGKRLASDQPAMCSESRNRFPHDLSTDSFSPIICVAFDALNK
jgi:hypothetical protein